MTVARIFTAIVLAILSCVILYLVATSVHGKISRAEAARYAYAGFKR